MGYAIMMVDGDLDRDTCRCVLCMPCNGSGQGADKARDDGGREILQLRAVRAAAQQLGRASLRSTPASPHSSCLFPLHTRPTLRHARRPSHAPAPVCRAMVKGKPNPLVSSFKLSYYTLLNLLRRMEGTGGVGWGGVGWGGGGWGGVERGGVCGCVGGGAWRTRDE